MGNILVICPYAGYMLKSIVQIQIVNIAKFTIIGSRKKIIEKCYIHKVNYKVLNIIDIDSNMDICFKANELLQQTDFTSIIFGDFPQEFSKKIVSIENDICIVDTPQSRHLLIVPRFGNDEFIGFEEKKQAIIDCQDLISKYNISFQKIGFVTGAPNSTLNIEKSIIRLDDSFNDYHLDIITVDKIIPEEYNILIFNSRDTANVFIDTILLIEKAKYASIKKASKYYVIDACDLNFTNLFFTIFMVSKIGLNAEAS